ncbi:M56 family peptidase, partial [Streptomyces albidoflavus]
PPAMTRPGLAFLMATTGAAASAASSANAALTLLLVLKAATPL